MANGEAAGCPRSRAGLTAVEERPGGTGSLPSKERRAAPGSAAGGQRPLTAQTSPTLTGSSKDSSVWGETAQHEAAVPMPGGAGAASGGVLRGRSRRLPPAPSASTRSAPPSPAAASCTDTAAHAPPPAPAARRS